MKEQTLDDFYPLPWIVKVPSVSKDTPDLISAALARTDYDNGDSEHNRAIKISGNLVYSPRFDIRGDNTRVNFVLAQHGETGETTYHRIFSTKEYAKRIQNKGLRKGDLVEIAGVWQKHVLTDAKTGNIRETPVFYCYGASLQGRKT